MKVLVTSIILAILPMAALVTTIQVADAKVNCRIEDGSGACSGGSPFTSQPGGSGGHDTFDARTGEGTISGGAGGKDFPSEGTNGRHCEFNRQTGETDCVGEHFSGK